MDKLSTILLIEDDKMVRHMLKESLEKEDFLILEATHGQRALDVLTSHKVDTILLDLHLPDGYGLNFITAIQEKTDVPLIIVSGEEDEDKKIKSFELGADDFVAKPLSFDLLTARIKAHIRRYAQGKNLTENHNNKKKTRRIKFDQWEINHLQFQLFNKNGNSADLTIREFNLLNFLISNANRAIPREELCEITREDNYVPTPRAIDVKVTRIRKKIGDDASNPQIIQTMRGVGYMFNKEKIITE